MSFDMSNPAFTKNAVRRATAQEFEAALIGRTIKPSRRDAAYRMIVLGEKTRDIAEALGMKGSSQKTENKAR